jgi:hypothetical protein
VELAEERVTGGVGGRFVKKVYVSKSSQTFLNGVLASTSRTVTQLAVIQMSIVCLSVTDVVSFRPTRDSGTDQEYFQVHYP